ncbi:GtrA family protein [Methanocella sp. CWC-04]|uniref:GtrA family protein n=2 Tax=Methanooceanicella nereidis TaxID=2052831 RepID=A0AAP2W604_9EURY|nr:GtrA family protein [Methanocella sp. CWC-04]
MGSLFVLNDFMNVFYLYANICSYTLGMVISFYLNKYYNFKNTYKKVHYQFISFALVAVTGLVLNTALMYVFVHYLFSNDTSMFVMISKLIATFIVFIWNFFINKSVTFKVFQ